MITTQIKYTTDTWMEITWEDYLQLCDHPQFGQGKFYYYNQKARIEMTPLGNDHSSDHSIITYAIHLYAGLKSIPLNGKDCCSYRQAGVREVQPDLSFYVGDNVDAIPYGTSIVNLDSYSPPNLVIEVANTSLNDDKGEKRLLYEDLGVEEYWIVDVKSVQIIAFKVEKGGSWRIIQSQVLPKLEISLLVEALQRSRQTNHSQVSAWLLEQFQANNQ